MTDVWEDDDAWAEEVDHDASTRHSQSAPDAATTWSDLRPALLTLGLLAAASIALGVVALQRSGVAGAIGPIFFFSSAAGLLFIILRGAVRLARTGNAGRSRSSGRLTKE